MSPSPVEVGSIVSNIATVVGVIIAFVKLRSDQQKSRKEMELSVKYLKSLSELVQSQASQQQLERDKLNWQKLTDLGKGLWAVATYEEG